MVQGCIQNGTTPDPATATEAADCVFQQLPKLEKLGLKFVFGLGNYPRQNGTAARVIGGAASEGGITETGPQGYPTTPEIAWVVAELARRNLSHVVAQYFLHDDDADTSGAVEANVRWLKAHAPHITPQTNPFPDANPEMLYQTRQFVFAPEEYSITGRTGNASNAAAMAQAELSHFANNQMLAERYRLDAWPLFGMCPSLPVCLVGAVLGTAADRRTMMRVSVEARRAVFMNYRGRLNWTRACWSDPRV